MTDFFGQFHWFTGVVEDRQDPLMLGRVRVRIVGYHTADTTILPTADLPWASVTQPITSAAMSGIGETPLGLVEGTWVVGFFSDGEDNQLPIIMGSLGGIPQSAYFNNLPPHKGFVDPNHVYPKTSLLDEPDTNRLARGITTDTIVPAKNSTLTTGVTLARGAGTWSEPSSAYNGLYPYDHVLETESGHVQEFDDTPGAERIHTYHKTGTFVEIDQNGTRVTRIVGDNYEILERNGYLAVKGSLNITIFGDSNLYVKNNCNLEVDGNLNTDVHGNYNLNVAGTVEVTAGGEVVVGSAKDIVMAADGNLGLTASEVLVLEAGTIAGITAPITEMSSTKIIAVFPTGSPGKAGEVDGTVDTPVGPLTPTEPVLPPLGFVLSPDQQKSFAVEKIQAFQASQDTQSPQGAQIAASEYSQLKTSELNNNMAISAPTVIPQTSAAAYICGSGVQIATLAKTFVGILESGPLPNTLNYGGKLGGGQLPAGTPGLIDTFLASCGLDNQSQVKRTGLGFFWCAAFVNYVWKQSGISTPNSASCSAWESWAHTNGTWSATPKVGAIILYGPAGSAEHVGIVVAVDDSGKITTVEGNTSGLGYTRNGVGCFAKTPRPGSYSGFILPPQCVA